MAVGDEALAAGFPLVPNTGPEGLVRYGAREINRTRDFIAEVISVIAGVLPVVRGGTGAANIIDARVNLGITSGTDLPSGGNPGDIYFRIIS
jgi:hypothetical protein